MGVFGVEGSGCGGSASAVLCCQVEEGNITSDNCDVHAAESAAFASCNDEDKFLRGVCNSASTNCDGGAHSITCCDYYMDDKKMYPQLPYLFGSQDGFYPT